MKILPVLLLLFISSCLPLPIGQKERTSNELFDGGEAIKPDNISVDTSTCIQDGIVCLNNSVYKIQSCQAELLESCDEGQTCLRGQCTCLEGQAKCIQNGTTFTIQICRKINENNSWVFLKQCAAQELCTNGKCTPPPCQSGTTRCQNGIEQICKDEKGVPSWINVKTCADLKMICDQNEQKCKNQCGGYNVLKIGENIVSKGQTCPTLFCARVICVGTEDVKCTRKACGSNGSDCANWEVCQSGVCLSNKCVGCTDNSQCSLGTCHANQTCE